MENLAIKKSKNINYIGINKDGVNSWKGIKYAKSPMGENRFKYAEEFQYEGDYEAFNYKSICPQNDHFDFKHSEDCLHLNIWANEKAYNRPVILYIHGGSFSGGTSREAYEDGSKMAKSKDIIIVTIEYRLNVFGMIDFSFLDENFKPNCGINDCIDALKWTYENIEAFGGDKDNITIMGESAGGSIVSALLSIDKAKKYINKAIITSGVPTSFITKEESIEIGKKYMEYMQISTKEELLKLDYRYIEKYITGFSKYLNMGYTTYIPCVDKKLLTEFPLVEAKNQTMKKIPILIGMTKDELVMLNYSYVSKSWNIETIMDDMFNREKDFTVDRIKGFYKGFYGDKNWKGYFYSDAIIKAPLIWLAEELTKYSDVWTFQLDWSPSLMQTLGVNAYHSSDLYYIFGNISNMIGARFISEDQMEKAEKVSESIQEDILNFVEKGRLNWETYSSKNNISKRYDYENYYGEIIPKAFLNIWEKTKYYKNSLIPIKNIKK